MFLRDKSIVYFLIIANLILAIACTNNTKQVHQNSFCTFDVPVVDTLLISSDYGNFKQISNNTATTDFVILQEDDNTMFADINQVIDAFGKYFIIDTYGSRTVVSFDHNGKPLASYGKHGNAPDEYIYPWDVDISVEYIYILDVSQRKLLRYNHIGDYIDSKKIPFESRGFILLNNNKILFNLEPSEDTNNYQLCITDSTLKPLKYMLCYPDKYVGGWVTNDVFLRNNNGISYYNSPADTIYRLDYDGNLVGKRLLSFANGTIDESAKLNFVGAEQQGKLTNGMHLLNNPFELPNGICVMEVTDYSNKGAYVVTLNPGKKLHRAEKFADHMSIYDVIKSRKTKSDGREKRKAIFEAKTKCAQKSRLLPPSGQNTSVVQTPFESCLKDAFLLNFLLKYHLKTHCQFSKKSYLYIVVMLPLCIPSRPHS